MLQTDNKKEVMEEVLASQIKVFQEIVLLSPSNDPLCHFILLDSEPRKVKAEFDNDSISLDIWEETVVQLHYNVINI